MSTALHVDGFPFRSDFARGSFKPQNDALVQALLIQDPGLMRQLASALPPGAQVASNATLGAGAHAQGPAAQLDNESIEKRSAT